MLILFIKSQLSLFDEPVRVNAHVRKDGTVVKPHVRVQKVARKPPVQASLFADAPAPALRPRPKADPEHKPKQAKVVASPSPALPTKPVQDDKPEIVEHTTKRGRVLRGIIRRDLTLDEAKKIDEYTFRKDGGYFIREKHLQGGAQIEAKQPETRATPEKKVVPKPIETNEKPSIRQQVRDIKERFDAPPPDYKPGDTVDPIDLGKLPYGTVIKITNEKFPDYVRHALLEPRDIYFRKLRGQGWQKNPLTPQQRTGVLAGEYGTYTLESLGDRENERFPRAKSKVEAKPADQNTIKKEPELQAAPTATHNPSAPFGVEAGIGKGKRREINAAVIERLSNGGPYTDEDRALLRQYSGNGGVGDSLNEYYTDPAVAAAMWTALGRLGFTSGTALEPSCATGVFMHKAPAGVKVTGVELDPVSAEVATALHGDRHEIHTASLERFATTDDRQFDVVIGNPPFGPRGYLAKDDKVHISTAEQYFTDTALDKCKPNGLVALIVPTGIMDSKTGRSFREGMLRKAEFLGAQRMPNTAFEHSHTEVTTDVIFLRKRPDDVAGALGTVDQATLQKLGIWDDEFLAGTYYTGRGAGNVLGTMTEGWRARAGIGSDITVEGSMIGVADSIAEFQTDADAAGATAVTMQDILRTLGDDEAAKDRAVSASMRRPYASTAKVGDTKVVDGVTYVLQGEPPRWHRVDEFMQTEAISAAQEIAADIDRLITGGAVDRPELEARIRAYIEKHGIPADNPDLMTAASVDRRLFRLVGAVNRKGELSDTVLGKAPRKVEGGFDATAQLLALERDGGEFTADELADRLGKSIEDVTDQLAADSRYAYAGDGRWTTMDAYLTGELWPKLDAARQALEDGSEPELADKRRLQVKRLEDTIDPKTLEDVDFQMNSAFIPPHVLAAFLNWNLFESDGANQWTKDLSPVEITFDNGVYSVKGGNQWGDSKLIDKYLNRTGIRKEEDLPRIERMNPEFKEWLCASSYRDAVEDIYNRSFRGYVAPEFSDEPIDIPGIATDRDVRQWRWSSLRRSLAEGKGIIADDVGLGKTLGGLLLARMAKIQGRAQKPIIVVPKSVLANWFEETETWFPGSRILTIGADFTRGKDGSLIGKDDKAAERKRKYHDLTQNDYDFVIISEPAFEEVDLDPVKKEEYYSEDFWVQRGESMGNAGDKRRKAIRERYEQHIAQREFSDRTDAIYFNELGVDMLLADEMHHQKNLYAARARFGEQPKFLGGQGLSNRALDFNLKTRWIRESNGGKNVYGLTATPTKNSPLEIYSMLSHIAPEAFERIGVRNSEEFLDRFCEFKRDKILSTAGEIEDATVVSGFKNLDELREIMARFIDRRTAEDVGLELPKRQDRMHLVDMSSAQQAVYADLRDLAEKSAGNRDAKGDSHIFAIMDKMNKAALDLSILDPETYPNTTSPKYAALAKECVQGVKDGGQIVFCEYIDSHDKIIGALVDAGFKRDEIGVINAKVAGSAVKRQNIANAFNAGKLKVVVGNATMAEGLNMQKTTTDIHHMDVPWEPATLQQRNGRGLRQGNYNEAVRIHTYLSRGSFDGYRYQAVAAKRDWQDLLWHGGDRVENLLREGAFSNEDMRIMLAADPEAARQKYEEDKAAATERYDAAQRSDAQSDYVRFVEMSRSYKALKNKGTASATRLRQRIESAKTSLFNNKYWPAKDSLDSATDVLIHPQTGTVLGANTGLEFPDEGKMVVTGVNMKDGTVSLRRYADTAGARRVSVPISDMGDAKPFSFDSKAEAEEVGRVMAAAAEEKLNSLSSWDDVKAMPSAVLTANYDVIQRQIKDGAKAYSFRMPYGSIPMVDRATGKLKMAESYEHTKLQDTHDYLLPTDDAKEKAIQAWIDAQREAKIKTRFQTSGNRRSQKSVTLASREYPGSKYDQKHENPFRALLSEFSGHTAYGTASPMEREARARLESEQYTRIRRASDVSSAIEAIAPLAKVTGREHVNLATYPQKALTTLWARARRLGALGNLMREAAPDGHHGYAFGGGARGTGEERTVHSALIAMARVSGHADLADAMAASAERHVKGLDDAETLQALTLPLGTNSQHTYSERTLDAIRRIAERMRIADRTLGELKSQKLNLHGSFGTSAGYFDPRASQNNKMTLRQKIDELAAAEVAKEAA